MLVKSVLRDPIGQACFGLGIFGIPYAPGLTSNLGAFPTCHVTCSYFLLDGIVVNMHGPGGPMARESTTNIPRYLLPVQYLHRVEKADSLLVCHPPAFQVDSLQPFHTRLARLTHRHPRELKLD